MNKPVEITMKELHIGVCKTVVSLQIGADTNLEKFMESMIKSNPAGMGKIQSAMETISSEENYTNETKYKSVSEKGIYEIKSGGIRLYCFQDRLGDNRPCLIITTNGGSKNSDKEQNRDIKRAAKIRNEYLSAKEREDTELNYQLLTNDEN